jgi:hypothetical protein
LAEPFTNLLIQPSPVTTAVVPPAAEQLPINCNRPSRVEISKAIKAHKKYKAPEPNSIPPEARKADMEFSTEMLHNIIGKIWEEEVPKEWKYGHIIKKLDYGLVYNNFFRTLVTFILFECTVLHANAK